MRIGNIWKLGLLTIVLAASPVQAGENLREYDRTVDGKGCEVFDFEEVKLKIPASWSGKYSFECYDDGVEFYHKASRKGFSGKGYGNVGGVMFSLCFSRNLEFTEYLPDYKMVGSGENGTYYLMFPTDVQGYTDDEEIFGEWAKMTEDLDWVTYNVTMRNFVGNVIGSLYCGDYILSDSDTGYLEEADLYGMNVGKLQMAINEIYARRGRRFQNQAIQEFFDSKIWYNGTVPADQFEESVFNKYEAANIALLQEYIENPPSGQGHPSDHPQLEEAVLESEYTEEEIGILALDHYERANGYRPQYFGISLNDNGTVSIQLYDLVEDHISTSDWYVIDPATGKGKDVLGRNLDIF